MREEKEDMASVAESAAQGTTALRSDTQHSAGPWSISGRYDLDPDDKCMVGIDSLDWGNFARVVVRLDGDHFDIEEGLANARLIAAAPELLAALKDMREGWRYIREHHGDLYGVGWDRAQSAADAAIAKAEGR